MLPTNRYGDLLKELFVSLKARAEDANAPLPSNVQIENLQRIFNEFSDRDIIYKSWAGPGQKATLNNLDVAGLVSSKTPISRVIQFESNAPESVPNAFTEHTMNLSYTSVGNSAINKLASCVGYYNGVTTKFSNQMDENIPLLCFGIVEFEANATGDRVVYINSYAKADDALSSGEIIAVRAASAYETYVTWCFVVFIPTTHYLSLVALHNGSAALNVYARMGFAAI